MIEIRELVIRATVDNQAATSGEQTDQSNAAEGNTPALAELVEQLSEMIKEQNER